MRRWMFYVALATFCVACYLLYTSLEVSSVKRKEVYEKGKIEIGRLEERLRSLEDELRQNEELIGNIRGQIYKLVGGSSGPGGPGPITSVAEIRAWNAAREAAKQNLSGGTSQDSCQFAEKVIPNTDVQMLEMYDLLKFDNPDGGAWKQGWDIKYDVKEVETKKPQLQVFVVPHSHCDPGWIKTFERYYTDQTKNILDNMVAVLSAEKSMKFIFAEISFFERWWADIDDIKRNAVRELLKSGQLEIVTGAWVMTDEANAHYFAMIDQMIEGHQWLKNTLEYTASNHWSIDPFGLSPTLTYILSMANFTTMTIQRVHYAVKKHLAKEQSLEFMWRQLWADTNHHDMFTHVFPFYSYDIPHTCGPDPKTCCQFDFARLPGSRMGCPWREPPVAIDSNNVKERAAIILDQWRKKAELYRTNVLLIPLGDDFRYDEKEEWNVQFKNYRLLMDQMNAEQGWNVKAQFGTLNDYFKAVFKRSGISGKGHPQGFPVLSGDFFTYADRDDHYWSGYYTSRPLYKRMDRVLMHYLRGAEIIYSMALAAMQQFTSSGFPFQELYTKLVAARRAQALFQHHDGITGTAKDHVVLDYAQRMIQAINNCMDIITMSSHLLLAKEHPEFDLSSIILQMNERRMSVEQLPDLSIIQVSKLERNLYLYNSLPWKRTELVCLDSSTPDVAVVDAQGKLQQVQIGPMIYKLGEKLELSRNTFEICFIGDVPPLGISQYTVKAAGKAMKQTRATVASNFPITSSHFHSTIVGDNMFLVNGSAFMTKFSTVSGFLQSVSIHDSKEEVPVKISFMQYNTVRKSDKSGAYLFLPDGPGKVVPSSDNKMIHVSGPLFSCIHTCFTQAKHSVRIMKVDGFEGNSIQIKNEVDIKQEYNYELGMRIMTGVDNKDGVFHTDLNGLQMIKRKYFSKLPIQGNFYPMPTAAYMENEETSRFTLLTVQPLGIGSLKPGMFDVILDRRLMQDDNRGLGQGITDNQITPSFFRMIFEKLTGPRPNRDAKDGHLSLFAHHSSLAMLHPLMVMYQKEPQQKLDLKSSFTPIAVIEAFPCDTHLLNWKTLAEPFEYKNDYASNREALEKPRRDQAMLFHRFVPDCRTMGKPIMTCGGSHNGRVNITEIFGDHLFMPKAKETSLTLTTERETFDLSNILALEPMDIRTLKVHLRWHKNSD